MTAAVFADRLPNWTDRLTVTIKPTWICNLRCKYCYQGKSRPVRGKGIMAPDVLEAAIREASKLPVETVDFQWIGGETLAPGVAFYKKALDLTNQYAREDGPEIVHWFQTNLTLIDEEWIEFLKDNDHTVLSVSYDFFEDYFLQTQQNRASAARHQWQKIQRALELLKANDIEFGCLTTIDENALRIPADKWFARWIEQDIRKIGLQLDYGDVYSFRNSAEAGHPWRKYVEFLEEIFALQEKHNRLHPDRPVILRESLYLFNKIAADYRDEWVGSCHHMSALCGHFFWTIDLDGEVYGMCDAFMTEDVASRYRLGNVLTHDVAEMKWNDQCAELTERQFRLKRAAACRTCPVYAWCNGGCPAFKSSDNMLDRFDDRSVYCEFTRAYFSNIIDEAKRTRIKRIYDRVAWLDAPENRRPGNGASNHAPPTVCADRGVGGGAAALGPLPPR